MGALTAGNRQPWAHARKKHFSKGVNKSSLYAIEKAAFVVVLLEEEFPHSATVIITIKHLILIIEKIYLRKPGMLANFFFILTNPEIVNDNNLHLLYLKLLGKTVL